jgi:hypothetical protein
LTDKLALNHSIQLQKIEERLKKVEKWITEEIEARQKFVERVGAIMTKESEKLDDTNVLGANKQ